MADIVSFVEDVLVAVAIIIATFFLARSAYTLLRRFLDDRLENLSISKTVARTVEYVIIAFGLFVALVMVLNLNLQGIAISLGIIGIAVAFSSQQVIQNFLAGVLIMLEQPVKLEEWIELPGTGLCKVKDINLTNTILRSVDGRVIILPNSAILDSRVINYTRSTIVEVTLKLEVPFTSDYEAVKRLILTIIDRNERIYPGLPEEQVSLFKKIVRLPSVKRLMEQDITGAEAFQPLILITSITASSISLDVHIWIREIEKKDLIVSEVMEQLLVALKALNVQVTPEIKAS